MLNWSDSTSYVMCQEFAGCRESYFLSNGDCLPCSDNCITCVSNTNCTKCSSNYYGLTCQQECLQKCEDICHKKYGYCTYGCVDGQFPEDDAAHCSNCPSNCTLCKSSSECVMCHPGHHGKTCDHPCENNCDTCDQKSGNCTACAEGYFNKDGRCNKCPVGCVGCYDNKNCSVCMVDYLRLHDGQCIMKCPRDESEMSHVTIGQVKSGIMNEQTINDNCKCSRECLYKTTTPCIRSMTCPEGHHCSTDDTDTVTCAAILTYECIHKYQPLNEGYHQSKPNCSTINRNTFSEAFCLTSTGPVSVNNMSTATECLQASTDVDTGSGLQGFHIPVPLLTVILVALCIMMLVTCVVCAKMYCRGRRCKELFLCTSMRKDTSEEETGTILKIVLADKGHLDTKQHPQRTLEVQPFLNEEKHTSDPTMMTGEITELDENACSNIDSGLWERKTISSCSSNISVGDLVVAIGKLKMEEL